MIEFRTLEFKNCRVDMFEDGVTRTTFWDGAEVVAAPQDNDVYRAHAKELGYGEDTALFSREHEIAHTLVSEWMELLMSQTLRMVALGETDPSWREEEGVVLAIQRLARARGVSLVNLAEKWTRRTG